MNDSNNSTNSSTSNTSSINSETNISNQDKSESISPPSAATSTQSNLFSNQSTSLLETTFADTLGLSMHNAITNQQNTQMTTAASITNACARLLKTSISMSVTKETSKPEKTVDDSEIAAEARTTPEIDNNNLNEEPKKKKRLNVGNFLKRNKNNEEVESNNE